MKAQSNSLLGQMKHTDALLVRYFSRYTRQASLAEDMSQRVIELCLEDIAGTSSFPVRAIRNVARAMLVQQLESVKMQGATSA